MKRRRPAPQRRWRWNTSWQHSDKVLGSLRSPQHVGSLAKGQTTPRGHRHGRRAAACGDVDEAADRGEPPRRHPGRARFKTLRLRFRRIRLGSLVTEWVKGQERLDEAYVHPATRRSPKRWPAASEDPLLHPGRGRHRGGGAGLPAPKHGAGRATTQPEAETATAELAWRSPDPNRRRRQRRAATWPPSEGKGVGLRLGVRTTGVLEGWRPSSNTWTSRSTADLVVREPQRQGLRRRQELSPARRHRAGPAPRRPERGFQVPQLRTRRATCGSGESFTI